MKKIHVRIMDTISKEYQDLDLVPIQDEDYQDIQTFLKVEPRYENELFMHVLVDEGYCYTNYYYPIDRYCIMRIERWSDEE